MDASSSSPSMGAGEGSQGRRRHWQNDAVTASLAARLQGLENEVHRLTHLSDKKDNAIRLLLVMKSVMNRKLGQRGVAGESLFRDDDNHFHTPYRRQQQQSPSPLSDFTFPPPQHGRFARAMPAGGSSRPRSPPRDSSSPYSSSYQNGFVTAYGGGGGLQRDVMVTSQVDADMQQYEKELKEVFQDEIVAHRRVQKNVELVSNDLHNMFALEDYLVSNSDLQLQIQKNKALQEGLFHDEAELESPNRSSSIRKHKTRMLEQRVLEDILLSKESKHEMALRLAQARSTAMISSAENATLKRLLNEIQVEKDLLSEQVHQEIENAERKFQDTLVRADRFKSRPEKSIARNRYSESRREQIALSYEGGNSDAPEYTESDASMHHEQESDNDDDTSISEFIFAQNETENALTETKAVNCQTEFEESAELHSSSTDIKGDAIIAEREVKEPETVHRDVDCQTETEQVEEAQPNIEKEIDSAIEDQPSSDVEENDSGTEMNDKPEAAHRDADCQAQFEEPEEVQPSSDLEGSSDVEKDSGTEINDQPEAVHRDADCQTQSEEPEESQPSSDVEKDSGTEIKDQPETPHRDADCQTDEPEEAQPNAEKKSDTEIEAQPSSDVEENGGTEINDAKPETVYRDRDCQTESEEPSYDVENDSGTGIEAQPEAIHRDADCQTDEPEEAEESQPPSDLEGNGGDPEINDAKPETLHRGTDCQTESEEPSYDVENDSGTGIEAQPEAVHRDADCQTEPEEAEESQPSSDLEGNGGDPEINNAKPETLHRDTDCQTEPSSSDVEKDSGTGTGIEAQPETAHLDADCQTESEEAEESQTSMTADMDQAQPETVHRDADCQTEPEEAENSQPSSDVEKDSGTEIKDQPAEASHVTAENVSFKFESGCDATSKNSVDGILSDSMLNEVKVRAHAKAGEKNSRLRKRQSKLQPFKYLFGSGSTQKPNENASQVEKKHNNSPGPRKRKLSLSGDDKVGQQQSRRNVTKAIGTSSEVFEQTYLNQIFHGVENAFTDPEPAKESGGKTKVGRKEDPLETNPNGPVETPTDIPPPPSSDEVSAPSNEGHSSPSVVVNAVKNSGIGLEAKSEQSPPASEEVATGVDAIFDKPLDACDAETPPNNSEATAPSPPDLGKKSLGIEQNGKGESAESEIGKSGAPMTFEDAVYAKLMLRKERRLSMSPASSKVLVENWIGIRIHHLKRMRRRRRRSRKRTRVDLMLSVNWSLMTA